MNFLVFGSLVLFIVLQAQGASAMDIFINGIHYASMEDYQSAKKNHKGQDVLSIEDQEYLSSKSKELGVTYDPNKLKTINIPQKLDPVQAKAVERLSSIGIEGLVSKVMVDFHQNWDNPMPKFIITSDELQKRLEGLVAGRKNPVLLLSGDHKLRVMELKEEPK